MTCPRCGTELTGRHSVCPNCGADLAAPTSVTRVGPEADDEGEPSNRGTVGAADREDGIDERVHTARGGGYLAAVSVGAGLLRGIGAFFSGFVLVGVVVGVELLTALQGAAASTGGGLERLIAALGIGIAASGTEAAGSAAVVLLKLIGWVFFAAHQVPVVERGVAGGEAVDVLAETGTAPGAPLTPIVYDLIPPLLLTWVGFRVAIGAGALSPETGLLPGASIALGYVPVGFVGAEAVGLATGDLAATVGPDPAVAALFAGIYACVFGAVGGLLGGALNDAELATTVGP
jgi:hypothetical protein